MKLIKINQLHAFEFDNGQDLLNGPMGTWFEAPENMVLDPNDNPTNKKRLFVRSQSCGPGWYQAHPIEEEDETEKAKTPQRNCITNAAPPQKRRFGRISQ